jgi:hypothetical protein
VRSSLSCCRAVSVLRTNSCGLRNGNLPAPATVLAGSWRSSNGIYRNVDYVAGVSDAETTAEQTFVDRAGVCRDFTHLGITLARALGMPARAVSAYALQLDPPDFHAIFEVYIENGWWLIDPTRLAPIEGIVRIGSGRDASDIAFFTTDKQCQVISQKLLVSTAR